MTRKKESILELLYAAPWWVSVVTAGLAYAALQFIVPAVKLDSPVLVGIPKLGPIFAPWVALMLLLPAPFSFFNSARKKRLLDKQKGIESIRLLSWKEFEELIGEAFRREGYSVLENENTGPDGGVDLWLKKNGNRYLVQCKQWKSQKVGVNVVREMYGLVSAHQAAGAIIVTSGMFTHEAKTFAQDKPLDLVEGHQLALMIATTKTKDKAPTRPPNPVSVETLCHVCGSKMVLRIAKKGKNAGQQFWGCTNYPKCKGTKVA